MNDYLSIQFIIYLLRWIVSAFVMMLPLYILSRTKCCVGSKYKEYVYLVLVQIFGAFIFYMLDKFILS